jgi:hypothetical protein
VSGVHPVVRYLIACEDVRADPDDPQKVTLLNLITNIRAPQREAPYPFRRSELCVYVVLTECQGIGEVQIRLVEAEGDRDIFRNRPRTVKFVGDPLDSIGMRFRILNCRFPRPGLYRLQFCYNGTVIAQQPILLQ